MRESQTIVINGVTYDTKTGLPINEANKKTTTARSVAKHHVSQPSHSATLRRDLVSKPTGDHDRITVRHTRERARVTQSPSISRFAQHPSRSHLAPEVKAHKPEQVSPVVNALHQKVRVASQNAPKAMSSRELKESLIAQAVKHAKPNTTPVKKQPSRWLRSFRASSLVTGPLALALLGGYFTYLNMPNLSVRVAAAQAGVDASYPGYTPIGFTMDGPVAYQDGEVQLAFRGNDDKKYQITQRNSSWDSQAVLDNFVSQQSKAYTTNDTQGLTVYAYGNDAAWVNHGIFYTIQGNAPLDTAQLLKIATSM